MQDNTKEANERLEAEHKRNMATMNEDTQAEIEKEARKSKERIRKMKAEAEREKQEARRNAEAEKADMEAEVNTEIEMANRKVDLAREIWASSKMAIADSAKRQAVFEEDKRRLNQRRNPVNFRIGNETFTKEEFRRGNLWELDQKLRRVVAEALNPESSARTVSEYCGIIKDAFQSVMGPNYGAGHDERYARKRLNTNIEAIAEITSTIFGNDFLSDVFPNAFNRIKAIYEGEE